MIECIYTNQKKKKQKLWKDGFIMLVNNKMSLYDEEKKKIYTFVCKEIMPEIETAQYLIYIDNMGNIVDSGCNKEINDNIDERNNINYMSSVNNRSNINVKNNLDSTNNDDTSDDDAIKPSYIKGRSKDEILDLFK
ncbi:Protein ZGRF1 [Astathelohania contejeani]|uniref:Protein ZGRF1 n=1 Tax=Astathelohania contejeani TaxID=164912 RepID=A0ABQ7HYZ2_9MICR|nr:Protein ZGRF1 [Thelohania contejeani]